VRVENPTSLDAEVSLWQSQAPGGPGYMDLIMAAYVQPAPPPDDDDDARNACTGYVADGCSTDPADPSICFGSGHAP
jgi:hypothetical protein